MTKNSVVLVIVLFISLNAVGQILIPADSLKKHVYYLASDSLEGRGLATQSGLAAANYIADYFKEIGIMPVGEKYLHPFYTRLWQTMLVGNNVVGIIEGSDPELKNEFIVLGAHYDHISFKIEEGRKIIYNGADDNASGTAAIIEIGRALVQQKAKLKRSVVIIAFDAEESGLVGSRKFIEQNIVPIENVKFMMSIDMIGRYAKSKSLIMGAIETLVDGKNILNDIANKHEIELDKAGDDLAGRTDSKPFANQGVPAVHATTGIIGPYHKPEDDRETLDYNGMEKISGLLYELTLELSNKDQLEPSKELLVETNKVGLPFFRYGLKANVGSSFHLYTDEFYNGKRRFSYEAGLMTQIKITKNISLQPEVLYSSMASGFNTGNFRTHSLSTPVSIVIASDMDKNSNSRAFATIGAYYAYHFGGSADNKSLDFDNSFEQTETGLVFGIGFEAMSVYVSVNFKQGLSSLSKDENMSNIKNRAAYFSMGYMF